MFDNVLQTLSETIVRVNNKEEIAAGNAKTKN